MTRHAITRRLAGEADTEALGREIAGFARVGDLICLSGELGAGKTTLARAVVRALDPAGEAAEVPSPTFTLVQAYEEAVPPVAHFDLFRVNDAREAAEAGFDDALAGHLVVVEWPDRLGPALPDDRLEVALGHDGDGRRAELAGHGSWAERLARMAALNGFLAGHGYGAARRRPIPGDASARRYERLNTEGGSVLVMDMPARPDGPPVRHGLAYSRIAHLAEDIRAVAAINAGLIGRGYSAPRIDAVNLAAGFAVIEDFGDRSFGRMIKDGSDIAEPLVHAVSLLADMARAEWPDETAGADGGAYRLAPYDREALMIEAELCLDWFWPMARGDRPDAAARAEFTGLWDAVLPLARPQRPVWVLRDYHVDNLFWLPERDGVARVGLIDTQDCVLGHPAYDLASLLQDVRVTVPAGVAAEYFEYYCAVREADEPGFDRTGFATAYAVLGAQRATKILGIFARLARRDGKPAYLRHMRRVSEVVEHNLGHPALAGLKAWFDRHLPPGLRVAVAEAGR